MFFCNVAAAVTFLIIRHQGIVAETEYPFFTEDNLTTSDNENSTTEYPNSTMKNVSFIPEGYNNTLPPKDPGTNITVTIQGIVIDRHAQFCNVTLDISFFWKDGRLLKENPWWTNDTKKLGFHFPPLRDIWHPSSSLYYIGKLNEDMVFKHESLRPIANPAAHIEHFIFYNTEPVNLKLGTEPSFRKFPADRHQCLFQLKPIVNKYSPDYSKNYKIWLYSKLDKDLVFDLDVKAMSFNASPLYSVEVTNILALNITFQRRIGSYIIQTYTPSGLFLILSWLSMFLPLDIATERVALCTATLLTLTTFTSSAKLSVPDISYMTGLDLWIVVSTSFIFLILAENICVLRIVAKKSEKLSRTKVMERLVKATTKIHAEQIMKSEEEENKPGSTSNQKQDAIQEMGEARPYQVSKSEEWKALAGKLDNISAAVIAVFWIIFNVIYWIWLFAYEDPIQDNFDPVKVNQVVKKIHL